MFGAERCRLEMVRTQLFARGVRDERVLAAMRRVPREDFAPSRLHAAAYDDVALEIADGQYMLQPFVIALMLESLVLNGTEQVLQIGSGAGYLIAILAELADQVYAIEPAGQLAASAMSSLTRANCRNVHMKHDPGTDGWREQAPFEAIVVSGALETVPSSLTAQLAPRGRFVTPLGSDPGAQEIVRVFKHRDGRLQRESIADVRFVPVIGQRAQPSRSAPSIASPWVRSHRPARSVCDDIETVERIVRAGEPFDDIDKAPLDRLIERIGKRRVVLIGESTHGSSEFYRVRARLTRQLIERCGFAGVAIEADWPDAADIDRYVRHLGARPSDWQTFARFPAWMWRNAEVREFVDWLHRHNGAREPGDRVGFHGLDLYSLYRSAHEVVNYLDGMDADLASLARQRYGCLAPWQADPAAYGHAALTGAYRSCEHDVVALLVDLYGSRHAQARNGRDAFFDVEQNARLVADAERYYRIMYYGSSASWNLRDAHMYQTLENLLQHYGSESKLVVWAHNSHVGDAGATAMSARGEYNLGELTRRRFGERAALIGFGTDHGTVAAASSWDAACEIMEVRPSRSDSHEHLFHLGNRPGLVLSLDRHRDAALARALATRRQQRAIGVIYRPDTELQSHYVETELSHQFDDYIWLDETSAVTPLSAATLAAMPDTYPFGL